jgi:hypothetical protein
MELQWLCLAFDVIAWQLELTGTSPVELIDTSPEAYVAYGPKTLKWYHELS